MTPPPVSLAIAKISLPMGSFRSSSVRPGAEKVSRGVMPWVTAPASSARMRPKSL